MSGGRHGVWEFVEGRRDFPDDVKHLKPRILQADASSGHLLLEYDGREFPTNIPGAVGGGYLAAMLDFAASLSPALTYSKEQYGPTVQLTVNFMRGTRPDLFLCEARTVTMTRTMAFVEAELKSSKNQLLAGATAIQRILTTAAP